MFLAAVVGLALLSVASADEVIGNEAFTAVINKDTIVNIDRVVKFPNVYTNHGGGYNSSNGVFTCHKGGIFVFHINAVSVNDQQFQMDLYKNNVYVISVFAQQQDGQSTGGNSVALRLFKNDKVVVKAGVNSHLYGRADEIYSTFSGYMTGVLPYTE